MSRYSVLHKRAIEYANLINESILEDAIVVNFLRTENAFTPQGHSIDRKLNGRTNGCGCKYCRTLYVYVQARIGLHRLKKHLYNDNSACMLSTDKLLEAISRQEKYCLDVRKELVKMGENMQVPNAVKRRAKYERF